MVSGLRLVLLAVLLAGCGGSVAPSAAPANPSLAPALPAGSYQSRAFEPQVTFTLPEGWWIAADERDHLELRPVSTDQGGIFLFRDPEAASQDESCPLTAEPNVGGLSTELAAWIRGLPGLDVSSPRLASVGGLRGTELDLRIVDGWQESCWFANGLPTVPLFVGGDSQMRWVVAGSEQLRLSLLDVPGGGTVVVDIDAFSGSLWNDLIEAATPIVNSFTFARE